MIFLVFELALLGPAYLLDLKCKREGGGAHTVNPLELSYFLTVSPNWTIVLPPIWFGRDNLWSGVIEPAAKKVLFIL